MAVMVLQAELMTKSSHNHHTLEKRIKYGLTRTL